MACGDWDRDGDVDLFIEMGGNVNGDKYHNILFQNPGQGNHWLTVKLVGKKTNRAAIGARIKVITAGEKPLTIYRHVSSGSSFGGNSAAADHRPGQGRAGGAAGDPLADQRDHPGLPRCRGGPGHRDHGVRGTLPAVELEADSAAEMNVPKRREQMENESLRMNEGRRMTASRRAGARLSVMGGVLLLFSTGGAILLWLYGRLPFQERSHGGFPGASIRSADEPEARRSRARASIREARFDEAFEFFQGLDEGQWEAGDCFTLGSALLERDRMVLGWAALEAARRIDPKHESTVQALDGLQNKLALATGPERSPA